MRSFTYNAVLPFRRDNATIISLCDLDDFDSFITSPMNDSLSILAWRDRKISSVDMFIYYATEVIGTIVNVISDVTMT